jgi:subtilase family serine protease
LPAALHAQDVGASSQIPSRISGPISESSLVMLKGNVSPLATAANDRGAAPASLQLKQMHLVLKRSAAQQTALTQLIQAQHDPSSPEYHQWLTPAEFGAKFGPSPQDVQRIESWLSSQGFSNVKADPGNQTIRFDGSVSQLQSTFHTSYHQYEINGQMHYAAATEPKIPSALAPVVKGFVSLNDFPVRSYSRKLGLATYNPQTHKATPQWTYPEGSGESFVVDPQDFGVEYDLPNAALNSGYSGTTYDGTGQTIAIINDSNINISLVNSFRTLFGLPANPPQVIIDGNDPGIDGVNNPDGPNGDSGEAYLDVEWAGAVAPKATVDLVIAADTASESGLILAAEHAVYSDLAPVMSVSFGNCEANLGASGNEFISSLWQQAAAEGITVVVSSGDSGAAGCDNPNTETYATLGTGVNGFASTPYNVAVGGTDFYYSSWNQGTNAIDTQLGTYWSGQTSTTPTESLKQYIPEQAWNDSQFGDDLLNYYNLTGSSTIVGGGGGASSDAYCSGTLSASTGSCSVNLSGYPKPSWQSGTGVPSDKVRDVPDVSLFAADGLNASYYPTCASDGDCQSASGNNPVQITGIGGTSAAAPAFAGIMALVNQATGNRQGQADMVLYPLAAQYPAVFHDVVNGSNSEPCQYSATSTSNSPDCIAASNAITVGGVTEGQLGTGTTPDYNAGTGYDQATGLGSVDAAVMIADWSKVAFTPSTVTLTSPTAGASFTHGASITFTGAVAGTGSSTPTGDVAIETSSTELSNQAQTYFTLNNGAFSGNLSYLPGGTYNVWAHYAGDSNNAAADSAATQITVSPEASTVLLQAVTPGSSQYNSVAGNTSIPYGTQIYVEATPYGSSYYNNCVNVSSPPNTCTGETNATGTVTFKDGSGTLGTATINAEGNAEYATGAFTVGAHTVTAAYSGDNSYNASTSSSVGFTVVQSTPTIQVSSPTTSGSAGQSSVLTILVDSNGIGIAPTGTVTVSGLPSGATASATLGSVADPTYGYTSAVATVTIPSSVTAGTYNLTINYGGDTNYKATSTTLGYTVGAAASGTATTIAATSSATSSTVTTPITVSATVTAASGSAAPSGTVYLIAGILNPKSSSQIEAAALAQATLTAGSGSSSTASIPLTSATLLKGSNYLTVFYEPAKGSTFVASSTVLNLSNPLSDFSMVATEPLVAINGVGGSTTDTLNVTSVNGFNGTVDLSCTAPNGLTCSLNQNSVSLTSSTSVTTGPVSALRKLELLGGGSGVALCFIFFFTIPARRRGWRTMLSVLVLLAFTGFGLGCSSSASSSGSGSGSGSGGGSGSGSGGSTGSVSVSGSGGSGGNSGPNVTVPVTVTITGTGSESDGNYQVLITGTDSSTSQVHTLAITTVVQN